MKNYCEKCDYYTSNSKDYKRHLLTAKHKIQQNTTKIQPLHKKHLCVCGKSYSHRASLYNHQKKCEHFSPKNPLTNNDAKLEFLDSKKDPSSVVEKTELVKLLKQNQDFKDLLVEQNRMMINQQVENQKLQKQLIEAVSDGKTITNITNNNNQKFNLNFFLNTTCKDAMNMSEFIENITIDFKDIEDIGKNGYVSGMTNMILSRIKDLDITKRPLHCTDLKRETMYIKDNNEWSKDSPENDKLRDMITIVAKQNYNIVPLWREQHPECINSEHPKYNLCVDIMRNTLGDVGNDQIKLDSKVIKNISKHILVK